MNPELCVYTIRLRDGEGNEQVLTKPCPFYSACRDQGRSCADVQAGRFPQDAFPIFTEGG